VRIREGKVIPRHDGKRVEEFVGRISTGNSSVSVARMHAPLGWVESAQAPEFDEVVIVLTGELTLLINNEREPIYRGEMGFVPRGTRVVYRNDGLGPCEYISICSPAFDLGLTHSDDPRHAITQARALEPVRASVAVDASNRVDIKTSHPKGKSLEPQLHAQAMQFMSKIGLSNRELSISLVTDRAIRKLNKKWRRKDKPTDVLSFPAGDMPEGTGEPMPLGDVVISMDTARRQAKTGKRTLDAEVARYLAHGVLHLLGFDHENEDDARKMSAEEAKLLGAQGMVPPWVDHGGVTKPLNPPKKKAAPKKAVAAKKAKKRG
jgi:probable rRNA maturation factor